MKKVNILGVNKAIGYLSGRGKAIDAATKKGVEQATLYVEGQVKDSIAGRNAEPRSVDTGLFMKTVYSKTKGASGTVASNVEYSGELEHGSSKRQGRYHFRNTLARTKGKVETYIRDKVKKATHL